LFNLNSNKVEINPKMVELCGYQSQELTGQVYTRFFHPDDRQASIEAIERHIRNATPNLETVERRAFHKDGRLLTLRITSFVTTLENDDRVLCSYIEDITEATQKETEMDAKSSPLD
jgi:PAS domain S-box-containing protein